MSYRASTSGCSVECNTCKKGYRGNDAYLDLTLYGSSMDYDETMPAATELFRYLFILDHCLSE